MSRAPKSEPTLSIRLLWPFARLIDAETNSRLLVSELRVGPEQLGNPETRLPREAVMRTLVKAAAVLGDPMLGIKAGQQVDHGDFDALEYAAFATENMGEAIQVQARFIRMMIDSVEVSLALEGEHAIWRMRPTDGVVLPPPANDYTIATAIAFSRRNSAVYVPPVEVRFMHPRTTYAEECARVLETKISFDAPYNTIVMHRSRLAVPMLRANPAMAMAFQIQVERIVAKLRIKDGIIGRVREGLAAELRAGPASMQQTARRLGMGVATLRRRLEDEETTFSTIVDEFRKELAERHLREADPTVSEIAFLLGFSDVRAFGRAFRRWTGKSPSEYRTERRSG